jgi:hypothetical protein
MHCVHSSALEWLVFPEAIWLRTTARVIGAPDPGTADAEHDDQRGS